MREEPRKSDVLVRGERLKELNKNPGLEMPQAEKPKLIEHFYWEITRIFPRDYILLSE